MTLRGRVWAVLCVACTPAAAQAPTNVNDCTLLPDPVALRRCVDGFGPQSVRPPAPALPSPAASDAAGSLPAPSAAQVPSTAQVPSAAQAPSAAKPAGDWLHEGAPATKPDRSSPNAIRLDD